MKNQSKRCIKVPIELCRPMKELNAKEHIIYIGFYQEKIKEVDYLIDIVQTSVNNYYVRLIDISDNKYKEVDLEDFKMQNAQPTLFSFFDL